LIADSELEAASERYQKGRAAMESGELRGAVEHFRASIRHHPHFKALELLGECLLKQGNAAEAVIYLSSAAGLGNRASRALFLLAQALLQIGDRDAAVSKLRQALSANSDYRAARELLKTLESSVS
jgi:tetratricopeptide (TPR) repeat protein